MRKLMRLSPILVLLLALGACGSGTENDPAGRTWELTSLEGDALVEGTTIDLTITDEGGSGNAGCNTYNGPVTFDTSDNSMTIGPDIISTMMACEEPIMAQEQKYLDALTRVTSYEMAPDELILKDAEGIEVAVFN